MAKYELLALDLDGTTLNEHGEVSAENQQAIQEAVEAGMKVMLATGRGVQNTFPIIEKLQLYTSPLLTVNGGEIWHCADRLFSRTVMETAWINRLHEIAVEHDTWYWAYAVEGVYNRDHWPQNTAGATWLKFGFYCEDLQKITAIQQTLSAWGKFEITNSHPCNLEINPAGINKAYGLQQVCDFLHISLSKTIAVGDSMNDIAMIRSAGLGVAMGNAQDKVKQAADVIAASHLEHGVSQVIRTFVLGEKVD